ncbi:substrate-binding domain-containing protein [Thioclava sp. GXIMD4216]|uniref:substrate-binding domain-containing protein n=1 Tax=Thioclava sp. GXIMD4216 TaxID=3131929 RepID=UPI0030D03D91
MTAFTTLRRAGCHRLALVYSAAGTPSLAGRVAGFRQAALAVPEALSVIGFDDIAQAGWESYALNTFAQPTAEIVAKAVEWLTTPESDTRMVQLPVRMVWRKSVRLPA